jgi:hypothetical protein
MPVRAILTSHPVAVTLSHVAQCAADLDEAHAPRLLNLHRAGAEHHHVADSRRATTYYSVTPGLPQGRLKYGHGNVSYEEVATLTARRCGRQAAPTAGVGRHFGGLPPLKPNE